MTDKKNYVSRLLVNPRGFPKLESLGELKTFPKNYHIVKDNEMITCCYVVKKGRIVGYEILPNGEERVYLINEQNSLLLESNVLYNIPSAVSFKTLLPTTVIEIKKEDLLQGMQNDPQIANDILESTVRKFHVAMEQLRHTNYHSAEWKICHLLLQLADHYGVIYDEKILIQEKVSQQFMADILGINRVTAVRSIKKLKDIGLIEMINGYFCIRSLELLQRHQERLL